MNKERLSAVLTLALISTAGLIATPVVAMQRPGVATPPNPGYVPGPGRPTPGTAARPIPPTPLDSGYWELYDLKRSVTLRGRVTRVEWTNPNSYVFMIVDNELWAIEAGYNQFLQSSVTPAISVNQTIMVMGYLPLEKPVTELPAQQWPTLARYLKTSRLIRAGEITTAFGQKLVMGRPPTETEMAERLRCSAFGCDLTPVR
jgi:hypothetical protein